jgi:hypothetical protein
VNTFSEHILAADVIVYGGQTVWRCDSPPKGRLTLKVLYIGAGSLNDEQLATLIEYREEKAEWERRQTDPHDGQNRIRFRPGEWN